MSATPAADLTVRGGDLMAFYGILRDDPELAELGEYVSDALMWGRMHSVGDAFPAVLCDGPEDDDDLVRCDLWRAPDDDDLRELIVERLDQIEGFDPAYPYDGAYVRQRVELDTPRVVAWVYAWNCPVAGMRRVRHGDWGLERELMYGAEG